MYQYRRLRWMKHLDFMVLDLLMVLLALILAVFLRFGTFTPEDPIRFIRSALLLIILVLLEASLSRNYSGILRREGPQELFASVSFTTVVMAGLIIALYILRIAEPYSRLVYAYTWILSSVFVFCGRTLLRKRILRRPDKGAISRRVLIITNSTEAETVIASLNERRQGSFLIDSAVIIDRDMRGENIAGVTVSAGWDDVYEYIRSTEIEEIFLHLPNDRARATFLSDHLKEMGLTVHISLSWQSENAGRNTQIEFFAGYTVLTTSMRIVPLGQLALKRAMDIAGALVGLVITGVIFLFVAPVIKAQSPGPVFFSQERIGKNGKRFRLYKFRSMYPDAEERKSELADQNEIEGGMMFKIEDDPRIFPFGRFMRRTSLDEFPQFFNVLRGDMSLVGTRPPTADEWEKYEYHYMKRLAIKPGITGLWQISGRSEIKDFEEVVAYDTRYIDEWSLALDIKILFRTVIVVATRKGAS